MVEVFLDSSCPNCGVPFSPDFSYGNLRRCKACKQWSVDISGSVNEKVIFRIIPFNLSEDELKKAVVNLLDKKVEYSYIKDFTSIEISKKTFPVREIGSGSSRRIVSSNSECSQDLERIFLHIDKPDSKTIHTHQLNNDENPELGVSCADYDSVLPLDKQLQFSEQIVRDKNIAPLKINISKEDIDKKFHLLRDDFYKIIYLPIYRISIKNTPLTLSCLGLQGAFGLDESIDKKYRKTNKDDENNGSLMMATAIFCALIMIFIDIPGCRSVFNDGSGFSILGSSNQTLFSSIGTVFMFLLWVAGGWIVGLILGSLIHQAKMYMRFKRLKNKVFI